MALEEAWLVLKEDEPKFTYIGTKLGRFRDLRRIGLYSKGKRHMPFYQSTGNDSKLPGKWLPFHGIDTTGNTRGYVDGRPVGGRGWLIKPQYFLKKYYEEQSDPRIGHPVQQEAYDWLNSQDLGDMEHNVMSNEELNTALHDAGATRFMHQEAPARESE